MERLPPDPECDAAAKVILASGDFEPQRRAEMSAAGGMRASRSPSVPTR